MKFRAIDHRKAEISTSRRKIVFFFRIKFFLEFCFADSKRGRKLRTWQQRLLRRLLAIAVFAATILEGKSETKSTYTYRCIFAHSVGESFVSHTRTLTLFFSYNKILNTYIHIHTHTHAYIEINQLFSPFA